MSLLIALSKISPTHHSFRYTRSDGTGESVELETKTFLFHDLLHFAVETEADLHDSFYGLLAKSKSYALLSEPMDPKNPGTSEIGITERVVGGLTGFIKSDGEPEHFLEIMRNLFEATNEPLPSWFTVEFILRVKERMRKLLGEWNATPFGKTMELRAESL